MKSKIVKTELGYEPAFWWPETGVAGEWIIEPGFELPTRQEAQAALDLDIEQRAKDEAQSRIYQSQIAFVCGERE